VAPSWCATGGLGGRRVGAPPAVCRDLGAECRRPIYTSQPVIVRISSVIGVIQLGARSALCTSVSNTRTALGSAVLSIPSTSSHFPTPGTQSSGRPIGHHTPAAGVIRRYSPRLFTRTTAPKQSVQQQQSCLSITPRATGQLHVEHVPKNRFDGKDQKGHPPAVAGCTCLLP
jgi:hypothetical protein